MKLPEPIQFLANERAPQETSQARLDGRTCVVTGGNSGVGFEAARRLARFGAQVVLLCRNPERAEAARAQLKEVAQAPVEIVLADLARLDDVRRAADELEDRFAAVHVLVNNAGLHSTRRIVTPDGIEAAFAVNHLASFLLTRLLLDRMKASAPARIVQVNSQGHRFNGLDVTDLNWERRHYTGLRSYGASKTAQLLTVWELADRLEGTGVTINAMHPGSVRSNIGANNGRLYRTFKRLVIDRTLADPEVAGRAVHWLAADPALEGVSGRFFNLTIDEQPARHALDRELGRRVWELSEKLTGLAPG
jgi:NAD(P)-dependent dehydrogenase (short-subunit alcohol dehydrogenase family)